MRSWMRSCGILAAALVLLWAASSGAADGAVEAAVAPAEVADSSLLSGTAAVDDQGNRGHVHDVVAGDTLWDISNTYLETPWVWPSIWSENSKIDDPHLIRPGDRIWISATEMRHVSVAEADRFIESAQEEAEVAEFEVPEALAAPDPDDAFSLVEELEPVLAVTPAASGAGVGVGQTVRVSARGNMSFVSAEQMNAATSFVGTPSPRTWLAQGDKVFLGLGEGEVAPGERYTIFREAEEVRDFQTGVLYGYHIDNLGWVEVESVGAETSVAEIRVSTAEIERSARVVRRQEMPSVVALKAAPADLSARIIYMPNGRTQAGMSDYVYIDRGSIHGLEVGAALEVFDAGSVESDRVRATRVMTPDWEIARLVVIGVQPDSAVAFVIRTHRELAAGDTVRAALRQVAQR